MGQAPPQLITIARLVLAGNSGEQIYTSLGISLVSLDRRIRDCRAYGLLDRSITLSALPWRKNTAPGAHQLPGNESIPAGWQPAKRKTTHDDLSGSDTVTTSVSLDSDHLLTLEELLEATHADPEEWEVFEFLPNYYEMPGPDGTKIGHWQIKAWIRRREDERSLEEHLQPLIERLEKHAYKYPKFKRPALRAGGKHLLEISPFDLHYGMLAWGKETGEDYDSHIAAKRFNWAMEDLLCKAAPYPVEEILFVVGNDLFHSDQTIAGAGGATAHGTPQDVDSRWQKNYVGVEGLIIGAIDRFLSVAPVHVLFIPGNHDTSKVFYLGRTIEAWYRNCKDVKTDNSPKTRKYKLYGAQLLGFTHGGEFKEARLPLRMAQEEPGLWSKASFREWHIGHWHRKKETEFFPVTEEEGVRIRVLPSLCGVDSWHYQQGFTGGIKAAEAYLWNRETGFAAEFSATLPALV